MSTKSQKSGLIDKLFLLKCVWNLIFGGFTMLTKHSKDQREQLEVVALSELVPEDHLVRKMEEAIDFSFIYQKVAPLYSSKGRPRTSFCRFKT
ncbi:hypothetical protein [Bacillus licheniformis]|uniref:hypothetical protein n=1 Tax=Bacillus licheniformis TaxID=1402 RepID=UPI003D752C30